FTPEAYLPELGSTATGPRLRARVEVRPIQTLVAGPAPQLVFLATPTEVSLEWAPRLLERQIPVIDLSGAFRLAGGSPSECRDLYREWYGLDHPTPEWVARAEFGLSPFAALPALATGAPARLIANPGCFATSVLMAL